jgi:hypothetical protein
MLKKEPGVEVVGLWIVNLELETLLRGKTVKAVVEGIGETLT